MNMMYDEYRVLTNILVIFQFIGLKSLQISYNHAYTPGWADLLFNSHGCLFIPQNHL